MLDKSAIFSIVQSEIQKRITTIQKAFDDINGSLSTATKSSAGDKHETGRAMAQLEQEKLSQQLSSALDLRNALSKIDPSEEHNTVRFGSLVQTSIGTFFISVGLGNIQHEDTSFFCISPVTPMGKLLIDKKIKDSVQFNGRSIEILELT